MDLEDINTVVVLGAGNMGHGIAEVVALAGYEVNMRDISEELVQEGYDQIEWSLEKLAERDQVSEDEAEAALDRVTPLVDLGEAVGNADVVIEAVPERMDIKTEVYEEVEEYAPDRAIFATNTSSLSITALSEVTDRPERFCGMHFFNPPVRMELVEVIAGEHTDEETLDVIEALAEDIGKTPVRVHKDAPGFIVNRILVPQLNEAAWLVHDGVATLEEVDSTTKYGMGLPMGSFELTDQVGVDVAYDVLEYMHEELGDAYEPCPLLAEKVESEHLGKKTGKGFYDYENGEGADVPPDAIEEEVADRLRATMANEIAKLLGEEIATADAIDEAMKLGAAHPEGPVSVVDEFGLDRAVEILESAREETGHPRYEVADYLRERAEAGGFREGDGAAGGAAGESGAASFETIRVEYPAEYVGHIVVDRPHRMNTISPEVMEELSSAISLLEEDDDVRAILLTGEGDRAFCAGFDVQSMGGGADPLEAMELSRMGQQTFGEFERSDLPVVAGIDGFCLGGGMELATVADVRIASERSSLGQPELNLGLIPGWGGTQRLPAIVGEGRAREIILSADRYDPETMADYGFVNEVVPTEEFDERALEWAEKLAGGPPIAQRFVKRAMLAGRENREAGLEIENSAFGHLAATEDLIEGITAFMGDREPEFEGK